MRSRSLLGRSKFCIRSILGVKWNEICRSVAQLPFGDDFETRLADLEEWTRKLQQSELEASQQDTSENPGLKLLDWFKEVGTGKKQVVYETKAMEERSATFHKIMGMNSRWLEQWFEQWLL